MLWGPTSVLVADIEVRVAGSSRRVGEGREAHGQQALVGAVSLRQHKAKVAEILARYIAHRQHLLRLDGGGLSHTHRINNIQSVVLVISMATRVCPQSVSQSVSQSGQWLGDASMDHSTHPPARKGAASFCSGWTGCSCRRCGLRGCTCRC